MDFSAGALPIRVKFCVAVRPHLRQVFSYFGGDSPGDGCVVGINGGHMAVYASCWSSCFIHFQLFQDGSFYYEYVASIHS